MPGSNPTTSSGKVMVIALDGATWNLARPWMKKGVMPNLAAQVIKGASADMLAELPPSSVPNWPAFMTGKNAGKHGCAWWLQRDTSGLIDQLPIDARTIRGDTIWSHISALGRKVIVQNVPVTYPVEPVSGVMVSGLLTPRIADDFVYPANLKSGLDSAVGGYQIYPNNTLSKGQEGKFISAQVTNIKHHAAAAEYLLQTQDWDFFILVLGPTDEAAHKLWHYMDPLHPRHNPKIDGDIQNGLEQIYSAADEVIGVLSRHLHENDTLIIMSDHGFGPVHSFFHLNNWLIQHGYLKLKKTGASALKQALYYTGFTPRNIYPLGKQILSLFKKANILRQRLDPGRQGSKSPLRRIFLSTDDVDWSRTRAIATGFLCGQIYINLQGRDPQGVVASNMYESLCEELIAKLATVHNPITNKLHYANIKKREELYSGPLVARLPDLLCVPQDLSSADSGMGFRSNKLFDSDAALSGTHREQGIFVMRGPGIREGVDIDAIRIFDLAPTIFHCMGLPIPDDLDGKVITQAFEEHHLQSREPQYMPARSTRPGEPVSLSANEEESVKNRLRELGYLN